MMLLLGSLVFFALSGRTAFPKQESIRIGYSSPSFGGLAMFVAQQKGIFKKYSLNQYRPDVEQSENCNCLI